MSATFTVVNPNADPATPVMTSFNRTSASIIGLGSQVGLSFSVSDGAGTGVKDISSTNPGLPFVAFVLNGPEQGRQYFDPAITRLREGSNSRKSPGSP